MIDRDAKDVVSEQKNVFEEEAQMGQTSMVAEFVYFLRHNKKWWLTPIILVLALVAVLIAFSSTAAAPFIYTLF